MESLIVTLPWHLHPATSEHPCLNSAMKQRLALLESLPGNVLEGNFSAQQIAVGLSSMGMDALRVWKEFSATRMDSSGGTVRASQCLSHTCDRLTWSDQGTSVPTWGKFSFGDLQRNHFGVSGALLPFYKAMHTSVLAWKPERDQLFGDVHNEGFESFWNKMFWLRMRSNVLSFQK